MSNDDNNLVGNVSTVLTWIWVFVSPYLADYVTQDQFVTLGVAIVGLVIAVWSSYNPNTFKFLKNYKVAGDDGFAADESDLINEEYEC